MGNNNCTINVVVFGLSGVGKTYFLDKLIYGDDTTKQSTFGFYEVSISNINFVEYGGTIPWTLSHHRTFDHVIMIIDSSYTKNQLREAKSALAIALTKIPQSVPLTFIIKGKEKSNTIQATLQMENMLPRLIAQEWIDFDENKSWEEGTSRLLAWIKVQHQKK